MGNFSMWGSSSYETLLYTCNRCKRRENARKQVLIGFSLFLIGWESGASFADQSQSVIEQKQSRREITFDIKLKTTLRNITQ